MPRLILASASPRRRELLALGWAFELRPTAADETPLPAETPAQMVMRLSEIKARHAAEGLEPGALVIGADTTVTLDGHIIGKPSDAADAIAILKRLRGREHEVFTGLTVLDTTTSRAHSDLARSRVPMRNYNDDELLAYVATGDPLDKAGAYAIQHAGFQPVATEAFHDCFANVMGLPLCHLLRRLRALNADSASDLPAACQRFIPYACPVSESILSEPLP
jgi:septum formation protein